MAWLETTNGHYINTDRVEQFTVGNFQTGQAHVRAFGPTHAAIPDGVEFFLEAQVSPSFDDAADATAWLAKIMDRIGAGRTVISQDELKTNS